MRPHRPTLLLLASLLMSLLTASAWAGNVEGRLWMGRDAQTVAARTTDAVKLAKAQRGAAEAVVWIEAIPEKVEQKLATRRTGWLFKRTLPEPVASIVQVNQRFRPRVLAVPAGARVEFRNADRVYHSTFSVSAAKRFDLGKYAPGRRDTVQFARRGVINLHSDIYPEMLGFVVVTPNHAYARPDSLGRFQLPKLPAGRYTVRAWHPQRGELKREIEVPKRGDTALELRF